MFNHAVASGGDIDGDGFADLLVAEPLYENGRGRVHLFFGSASGLQVAPEMVLEGSNEKTKFGPTVQMLGDVDGDGIDDFFISEQKPLNHAGWLLLGHPERQFRRVEWPPVFLPFPVGDLDGDGFDDVAGYVADGDRVAVYRGSRSGPSSIPSWIFLPEQEGSHYGHCIAGAGDVNGDGFDDLIIGAPKFDGRYRGGGKAYLYLGSEKGPSVNPNWSAEYNLPADEGVDDQHEQFFGWSVARAGDVNGDGFDDVAISACFAERGDRNEGFAFLFLGSKEGLEKKPSWTAEGNRPHAVFGQSVSTAFDVNGDGFDDLLVGIPQANNGQVSEGAVAIYQGSKSGLSRWPQGVNESDHSHETLGFVVRAAGDINGDGYADVLMVGPGFEKLSPDHIVRRGRVVISYGSPEGLPFRHNYSVKKPLLSAAQQRLDRYHSAFGSIVYWGPSTLLLLAALIGFSFLKVRDQRRITSLLKEREDLVRSAERTRITRDLHDHLGADLTKIAIQAKSATGSPDQLNNIAKSATSALESIEELVWLTDPTSDTLESFALYVGDFATDYLGKAEIGCQLRYPERFRRVPVAAEWRKECFSAVKEAVQNIVKHSGATRVLLEIEAQDQSVVITITDDGRGFNPDEEATGRGLSNIRERLHNLGGTVQISSSAEGTMIRLKSPITVPKF